MRGYGRRTRQWRTRMELLSQMTLEQRQMGQVLRSHSLRTRPLKIQLQKKNLRLQKPNQLRSHHLQCNRLNLSRDTKDWPSAMFSTAGNLQESLHLRLINRLEMEPRAFHLQITREQEAMDPMDHPLFNRVYSNLEWHLNGNLHIKPDHLTSLRCTHPAAHTLSLTLHNILLSHTHLHNAGHFQVPMAYPLHILMYHHLRLTVSTHIQFYYPLQMPRGDPQAHPRCPWMH
jgi:hypothetical protein